MSDIGYAVFRKYNNFIIDTNGLLSELTFSDTIFIDSSVKPKVGEKRICIQRIASNRLKSPIKDTILVSNLIKQQNGVILGSAIIFRTFQVNEQKIIDGVEYLLNQLIRNLNDESNKGIDELGVILPSVNGNFNIFKEEPLPPITLKKNIKQIDILPSEKKKLVKILHHFTTKNSFKYTTHLLLTSNHNALSKFTGNEFEKVNVASLISISVSQPIVQSDNNERKVLKAKLAETETALENEAQAKKKYTLFGIIAFIGLLVFSVLYFTKKTENVLPVNMKTTRGMLYPIKEKFYINNKNFNLNVRSFPDFEPDIPNIVTTISDGDEIFVIGLDKETLWAKIYCNKLHDSGYVSNKYISKQLNRDRVIPENKKVKINTIYGRTPLYSAPEKDVLKDKNYSHIYLDNNETVFVKNKFIQNEDIGSYWYSITIVKDDKVYNGYLKGNLNSNYLTVKE